MTKPLIEFRNVHKTLGSTYVLRGTNLQIPKGKITTIIGKSGTGKSVFFKHIIGLLKPDAGDIICDGKPMSEMTRAELWEWRGKFSYMFQNMALFDSMTVYENIALPLDQGTRLSQGDIEARVRERLQQLDIEDIGHKYPSELSGGMQKRVGLARAIAANPKIIFFDEPTTGLDPIMSGVINELVREIVVEMGATAMTITHDMSSVRAIADKVAMIHNGLVQWTGPIGEMDNSGDPYLDQFINARAEGPIEAVR